MSFQVGDRVWLIPFKYWENKDPVKVEVAGRGHNHPEDLVLDALAVWIRPCGESTSMRAQFVDSRLLYFNYEHAKAAQLLMCMLRDNRQQDISERNRPITRNSGKELRLVAELAKKTVAHALTSEPVPDETPDTPR